MWVFSWSKVEFNLQRWFRASSFYSKFDDQRNTLVIIKSINGNVFGGYTEQLWNHTIDCKSDSNAFIFSLINKENKPLKIKCIKTDEAIYCSNDLGLNIDLILKLIVIRMRILWAAQILGYHINIQIMQIDQIKLNHF